VRRVLFAVTLLPGGRDGGVQSPEGEVPAEEELFQTDRSFCYDGVAGQGLTWKIRGGWAKAWCLLIHAEASLSVSLYSYMDDTGAGRKPRRGSVSLTLSPSPSPSPSLSLVFSA